MERNYSIDAFRGLAIIGMVFFTVTLRLSSTLPEPLRHNVWGSVHVGDFILPMFLFASGLSLAYYLQNKKKEKKRIFLQKVIVRFIKLALVGISLSFFSAYGFLEMDEVMLNALLFIACVALSRFNWLTILGIIFLIGLSYMVILQLDLVTIFIGHYLGGYPAALFYLPIMLTGLAIGKGIISKGLWCESNKIIMTMIFTFFLFFLFFIPMNKMSATPPFILLSILFSILIFIGIEKMITRVTFIQKLEHIGRNPLRYWIMMYIIFLIPLWFYVEFSCQTLPLNIQWYISIIISLGLLIILLKLYRLIEYITISN